MSTRTARSFTFGRGPRILNQLIQFPEKTENELLLSDHITAYSAKRPLFIYHGTFHEPLFLSIRIPREKVAAKTLLQTVSPACIDYSSGKWY